MKNLLRHGIAREIYTPCPLAENFQKYLCGEVKNASLHRPPLSDIAQAAFEMGPAALKTETGI